MIPTVVEVEPSDELLEAFVLLDGTCLRFVHGQDNASPLNIDALD